MELTLFEVHLDDAAFTANAPFSGNGDGESADAETSEAAEDESGGRSVLPYVVGLAFLAGIGYLVRRRMSDGGEDFGTEVEPTVSEPEAPTP